MKRFVIGDHALAVLCAKYHALERENQELRNMNHKESRDRRRMIAQAVAAGTPRLEVGDQFGVSDRLVRMACDEHNVEYDTYPGGTPPGIVPIVAGLVQAKHKNLSIVARDTGNSKQRVHQVLQECIEYDLVKRRKFER